jgi:hypothetical protein
MGDMTDELDILLSRPLDRLVDDGFSARIVARIRFRQMVQQTLTWSTAGAGLLVLWLFVPVVPTAGALVAAISRAATSPAVALVAGSMVLIWVWEPRLFRL